MKRTFFSVFLLMAIASLALGSDGFVISGTLENGEGRIIKLDQRVDGAWVTLDSAVVENGMYQLSGHVAHPTMTYLKFIEGDEVQYIYLFVENSAIIVRSDMEDVDVSTIEGSASHRLYADYQAGLDAVTEPYDTLYALLKGAENTYVKKGLESLIKKVEDKESAYNVDFVENHPGSQVAAYVAYRQLAWWMDHAELKPLVDILTTELSGTTYVTSLEETLEKIKYLAIGQPAPVFSEADTSGILIAITDLRGKYVLLDFWASWCGPCRQENPNVVAMYNELGNDDFEILGISLDKRKEKWIQAIHDDELEWYHVSDLQGWQSEVADKFSVRAIPQTYLLDRNGTIVAKNLRGDELREKVESLIAQP